MLLVEDNEELAGWLARILRRHAAAVDCVHDGVTAEARLLRYGYDIVILDLSLPGLDGLEILRRLRGRGAEIPVIILTANSSIEGRVTGLDAGADDYLAKPFDVAELEARIRAHVRRASHHVEPTICCGALSFDTNTKEFLLTGRRLELTPREHAVLEHLIFRVGRTVAKDQLSQAVFGPADEASAAAIEIYIHRIRKKIADADIEIVTFRGLGYLLRSDHAAPA